MLAQKAQWLLIVDDDADIRELIMDDLSESFGDTLRFVEAADGIQATSKLDNQPFDCIITDMNMPRRNGAEFLKEVKRSSMNKSAPVIVLTGQLDSDLANMYKDVYFIEKPIDTDKFNRLVRTHLRLGRMDKRSSANLFNYLINSTQMFVRSVLRKEIQIEPPIARRSGDDPKGDHFIYLEFKTKEGLCLAGIGFDDEMLEKLQLKKSTADREKIALKASSLMLKYMLYDYFHRENNSIAVNNKTYIVNNDDPRYSSMRSSPGVVVPVVCDGVTVYLSLFHKV